MKPPARDIGGCGGPRPSVSVVIPAFGRHGQLTAAVASAGQQLARTDEIIVVDDGSSPPIPPPPRMAGGPAIHLIRSERNGGPAKARNLGIAAARNELIAFLDSDDIWLAGKLAAQLPLLASPRGELVAVSCGWHETTQGLTSRTRIPAAGSGADFFAGCWFSPGSTLVLRKSVFDVCGLFAEDLRRLEDLEWFIRFGQAGGKLVVADVVGASLTRGSNARPDQVTAAARLISRRHSTGGARASRAAGDLAAYLDLERSAAFANASRRLAAFWFLARSLLRRPRLALPLRNWWRR